MVLAGGLGTRLRPYTLLLPKPMLAVGPKPILEHIVDWLRESGIGEIVVATGYLGRTIERYFGDGSDFGVKMEYARSDRPLGHAGQLKSAEAALPQTFVCVYGDAILGFDLKRLVEFHRAKGAFVTMALMRHETRMKYGVVSTHPDGRILRWREKPAIRNDINVGCYVIERGFLEYIPAGRVFGMKEAFRAAMDAGRPIYALKVEGEFTDIGDLEMHAAADKAYIERYGKIP